MKHNGAQRAGGRGRQKGQAERESVRRNSTLRAFWLYKLNCANILYLFWSFMTHLKVKQAGGQQQVPSGRCQVANCRCLSTDTKLIKGVCGTFEI